MAYEFEFVKSFRKAIFDTLLATIQEKLYSILKTLKNFLA